LLLVAVVAVALQIVAVEDRLVQTVAVVLVA
jgi:hypothetical protein